jgi:AcrR family transcriptional regulator
MTKPVAKRQSNRRQPLLEAAARQFLRHGFAAASMRDIAADAGMQPGSIYYHFPSKADLLIAVHEEGLRRIRQAVTDALDSAPADDPWRRLEVACVAHMTVLLEGGDFFQAVMREMPPEDHAGRAYITGLRDAHERLFDKLLADLPLAPETDRHTLRLMLMGAMNYAYRWYRPGADSPGSIARKFVSFLRTPLDKR